MDWTIHVWCPASYVGVPMVGWGWKSGVHSIQPRWTQRLFTRALRPYVVEDALQVEQYALWWHPSLRLWMSDMIDLGISNRMIKTVSKPYIRVVSISCIWYYTHCMCSADAYKTIFVLTLHLETLEWILIYRASMVLQCIWVGSRRCSCLVTWFCYQLIAKPGNKTATPPWPNPYMKTIVYERYDKEKQWQQSLVHCLTDMINPAFPWYIWNQHHGMVQPSHAHNHGEIWQQ